MNKMNQLQRNAIPTLAIALVLIALLVSLAGAVSDEAKKMYNDGIKAKQAGNLEEAILSYIGAMEKDETYADPCFSLGAIYFEQKKYDKALEMFKEATKRDETNAEAFANLGRVQYKLRQYIEAEGAFSTALDLDSSASEYYNDLGKTYNKERKYTKAISAFEKFHELSGGNYASWYLLGKSYKKTDKISKAIAAYKKSVEFKSSYSYPHSALGSVYLSQEKFLSAAGEFQNVLKINPKNYRAAYNYAIAIQSKDPEDYNTNIKNWESFVKIAKKNPRVRKQMISTAKETIKNLKKAQEQADLQ
ncbi:MAG: tetratricopeptide repeat protein [candidate division Zixibacteria bacterium]|nr:tetratricopeptide repeat protein [candidate division Zixibacteria bacterium]